MGKRQMWFFVLFIWQGQVRFFCQDSFLCQMLSWTVFKTTTTELRAKSCDAKLINHSPRLSPLCLPLGGNTEDPSRQDPAVEWDKNLIYCFAGAASCPQWGTQCSKYISHKTLCTFYLNHYTFEALTVTVTEDLSPILKQVSSRFFRIEPT